ncbi:3-oxoacyl-ACP reductase [Terracoccus luteus]|uniref:3-oxoacyl-[acyl-carrier protein] reductase n=1 Tax=Terracoccus luteus TaxID=53356 RepID=A0A839PXA7_9MICO|nr:3-oxoacyl-ACP reductase [Terracoccus luteus]MBB2988167.1 3-oxoacyl-[acyl-carrier protein] reductase [Terracoccus luteus]MCP2173802.1 3-oxoacyl-[acyl-carrier protein] reductase [Terracoccus luteus]
MPDLFTTLATSPVARRVGVPQPTRLRRFAPGEPLCDSPVLVAGGGAFAGAVRDHLASLGVTTVDALEVAEVAEGAVDGTPPVTDAGRLGAVVLDLSDAVDLGDLDRLRTLGAPAVRRLARNARVVVVGRDPDTVTDLEAAVTQRALEGFVRSLGKELRHGATANLVLAQGDRPDGVVSAVAFFLSGRSAYVDGQVVVVGDTPTPARSTTLLAGQVAVVTGAARGIGADIARVLARDGARVVAVDVPSAGQALAAVANEVGGTALQLDITAPDAGTRIVEHARGRHGGLDVVVHNAGITRDRLLVNLDEQQWSSVVAVNLRSVLRMNEALLAEGGLGDGGRIVCVSSIAGLAGNRGQTNYAVSKAGVVGLVHALSRRVAGRGITVNAVAPGFIETEMTARIPFATREVGRRMNSLQQAGLPLDVAEAVCWLAQPTSGAVTGQVLRVCGQSLLGA